MIVETTDIKVIEREFSAIQARREQILALRATDETSFVILAEALKAAKLYVRNVKEFWKQPKADTDRAHKTVVAREKMMLAPGEEVVAHADAEVVAWHEQQERLRREAEAAAERERQRLEAEARRLAVEEEARLLREAEDAALDAAVAAEANGDVETAERILAQPLVVEIPPPQPVFTPPAAMTMPTPTKVEGLGFRGGWRHEVTSLKELVKAVAEGRAPLALVKADEVALGQYARSTRGTQAVPGVRFVQGTTTAVRG